MAAGMGADVTITDINLARLRYLSETLPKNVKTLYSSELRIRKELPDVDLVVGSVLIPGYKAPHFITKEMLSIMQPGTVLVDVAIDQGGCFETSHPTELLVLRNCSFPSSRKKTMRENEIGRASCRERV